MRIKAYLLNAEIFRDVYDIIRIRGARTNKGMKTGLFARIMYTLRSSVNELFQKSLGARGKDTSPTGFQGFYSNG